jgi:hypothetical protein
MRAGHGKGEFVMRTARVLLAVLATVACAVLIGCRDRLDGTYVSQATIVVTREETEAAMKATLAQPGASRPRTFDDLVGAAVQATARELVRKQQAAKPYVFSPKGTFTGPDGLQGTYEVHRDALVLHSKAPGPPETITGKIIGDMIAVKGVTYRRQQQEQRPAKR